MMNPRMSATKNTVNPMIAVKSKFSRPLINPISIIDATTIGAREIKPNAR